MSTGLPHISRSDICLRYSHPHLYWMIMVTGLAFVAVGMNFFFLSPTFEVFQTPYAVWASIFTVVGAAKVLLLHFVKKLRMVRLAMMASLTFTLLFGVGTGEPWIHGEGSLQLPILYGALGLLEFFMLMEPFSNPQTAKRP